VDGAGVCTCKPGTQLADDFCLERCPDYRGAQKWLLAKKGGRVAIWSLVILVPSLAATTALMFLNGSIFPD